MKDLERNKNAVDTTRDALVAAYNATNGARDALAAAYDAAGAAFLAAADARYAARKTLADYDSELDKVGK
jgi:aminoglycoside phosphotransferase (APT) family kinase protein